MLRVNSPSLYGALFCTQILCVFFLDCHSLLGQDSLADVIQKAEKSVVRIEVSGTRGRSLGSGFVVDDKGTVVTNCHVLAGADSAKIHFPNGDEGVILGTLLIDESRDIAIARLSITTAPALALAKEFPRKGETVTALGSPHGFSFSVTNGIVSAIRPAQEMAAELGKSSIAGTWIQVDAAISPGNSGGPLINRDGQVVGMCTLASQGSAQNLNFGISAKDLQAALKASSQQQLASLRDGVSKVRMEQSQAGPSGSPPTNEWVRDQIPAQALTDYIIEGQELYGDLIRGLRLESARLSADLKEMRKGLPSIPRALRSNDANVIRLQLPGKKEQQWYFSDPAIKKEVLGIQQERIRSYMKLKNQLRSKEDLESMFQLLWNYGPPLDLRDAESVGFVTDLFVVRAFNEHDVLASLDGKPLFVWLQSTVGISGGDILSGPVFVAGTTSIQTGDGLPTAITILQEVSESQIRDVLGTQLGLSKQPEFRTWRDKSGKYSVKAKLLGQDSSKVVLQKEDGSIVNVPKSSLCQEDRTFLVRIQE